MLSESQKELVLQQILNEPNVPSWLKGGLGKSMFPVLINQVDTQLSDVLPADIQSLINSAADGLDADEVSNLSQLLTAYVAEKVSNPILQSVLGLVLPLIVNSIVEALGKGKSL